MSDARAVCERIKGKARAAAVMHLREAIINPKIYFYGQLYHAPEVQELRGTEYEKFLRLIETLAFGTYADFVRLPEDVRELAPPSVQTKLRHLSIVQLAATKRRITYAEISTAVDMQEPRELEDLVIDAITEGLLRGRIDQLAESVEIFDVAARDVKLEQLDGMIARLEQWSSDCDATKAKLGGSIETTARSIECREGKKVAMAEREAQVMEVAKALELDSRDRMFEAEAPRQAAAAAYSKRGRDRNFR